MLKIGQNWDKIANCPLPMLNKDRHPCPQLLFFTRPVFWSGYWLLSLVAFFNLGLFFFWRTESGQIKG